MVFITLSKTFTLIHIRLYRRKILIWEARSVMIGLLLIFNIIILINLIFAKDVFAMVEKFIYLILVTFITFFWVSTWVKADKMLKHARDSENLYQKYLTQDE